MRKPGLVMALLLSTPAATPAQWGPPPVDLPIPNIQQETLAWCWVAVAQQIIAATYGWEYTPSQCALVAMAYGAHSDMCCVAYNEDCVRGGTLEQIQYLIDEFGGRYSSLAPPTNPDVLYETLASGRAVILQVASGQASFHAIVLRGMEWIEGPYGLEPILYVNDPLDYYARPLPFWQLVDIWEAAIVVN